MDRFEEDKLRVLRMTRFAHHFGYDMDSEIKKAIWHYRELASVSNERIRGSF